MTLEQLQQFLYGKGLVGENATIGEMAGLDSSTIMSQYLQNYNLEGLADTMNPSLFQGIPLDMLLQQQTQTYAPQKRSLETSAIKDMRHIAQAGGRKAYGGFAQSGQGNLFSGGLRDEFGKNMAGILGETTHKPMAQAGQALSDWTSQWDDAMLNLSGSGG